MFIYGFPNVGKTTFAVKAKSKGYKIVDTDDLVNKLWPEYFRKKLFRDELARKVVTDLISDYIRKNIKKLREPKNILISNMPDVMPYPDKWDYFVLHEKFKPDIKDVKTKEWGEQFTKQLGNWNEAAKKTAKSKASKVVLVKENEYLSDKIKI